MSNRVLAFIGVGAYILTVLASAEDTGGDTTASPVVITLAAILTLFFITMAVIRLWKIAQFTAVMLLVSSVVFLILGTILVFTEPIHGSAIVVATNIAGVVYLFAYFFAVIRLWTLRTISTESRSIPEIGREISWADIVHQVFRAVDFDRSGTRTNSYGQVTALSASMPYGYLLVESPILNQRVRLPIIHQDDFRLASSVFDVPDLAHFVDEELLVTYAPEHVLPSGLSGSFFHVLHFVIVPRGTLDLYYSVHNDLHMAHPDPEKLFGPF
ncbi:MAG TPA: hypothetical protein PKV43_10760, partial [Armatimonadota bacterium]|nr:hypothetical protein [Armatimonadota bacterium]